MKHTVKGFWITSLHPDYSCQALPENSVEGNPQSSHFHVSSHLLYVPFTLSFFRLVCLPPRLQAGKMHNLKATGSHSLPHLPKQKSQVRPGLSESFFFFTHLNHKKTFLPLHYLGCLSFFSFSFSHPPSEEFNKTGEMDVRDGCRSDSYPFFFLFFSREMDGSHVARSRLASGGPIVRLIACNQSHVQYGFWIINQSTSHWALAISCGDKLRKESISFAS